MSDPQHVDDAVASLETSLRLTPGFLESLRHESDWSFVIKAHAFLEAALTHLLASTLDRPELRDTFARLELSNKSTGKLAFLKSLSLLDSDARRFVFEFSELRNTLVHDVRNVDFTFSSHFATLTSQERTQFARDFRLPIAYRGLQSQRPLAEQRWEALVLKAPVLALWTGLLLLVQIIYVNQPEVQIKALLELLKEHEAKEGTPGA